MNFYNNFDAILGAMIDSVKEVLYARHNDIFDRLDFNDDDIYLEPLLYTYLNQKDDKWLDSIIYGYEKDNKNSIQVFSNAEGVVYIPKVGYFKTDRPGCEITLNAINGGYQLEFDGKELAYTFEPLLLLNFNIELQKYQHPLLELLFKDKNLQSEDFTMQGVFNSHVENINMALHLIKEHNPDHFSLLAKVLKRVILFTASRPNSFATMEAQNMVFLNVNPWDNEMFFVDHLSHEGAHVTFYILTYESKLRLFKAHFNTSFSDVTGDPKEHSTVYLRFHGLFTFYEILKSLKGCMLAHNLSAKICHEAKGRFAFQLNRFKMSLESFEKLDIYQEEGLHWLDFFSKEFLKLNKEYGYMVNEYDLKMPTYDFHAKAFETKNPIRL
jgi:hypothetical protein